MEQCGCRKAHENRAKDQGCRFIHRGSAQEQETKGGGWRILSVRITLSSRRVIDTNAASGGPEGNPPLPPSSLVLPSLQAWLHPFIHLSIHPLLLPAPLSYVRGPSTVFSPQWPAPGSTVMERGRVHQRRRWWVEEGSAKTLSQFRTAEIFIQCKTEVYSLSLT